MSKEGCGRKGACLGSLAGAGAGRGQGEFLVLSQVVTMICTDILWYGSGQSPVQ